MIGFKKKDRELFFKIAGDIRSRPDKYGVAGKLLDRYYGDDNYCQRILREDLEKEIRQIEDRLAMDEGVSADENGHVYSGGGLTYISRLAYALENFLADYKYGGVLSEEEARAVLIIAWVATDPEANQTDSAKLTRFAELPWKEEETVLEPQRHGLATILFSKLDIALHYQGEKNPIYELDLIYLPLVRTAWAKIEAEKELCGKTQSGEEVIRQMYFDDCKNPEDLYKAIQRLKENPEKVSPLPPEHMRGNVHMEPDGFEWDDDAPSDWSEVYREARDCVISLRESTPTLPKLPEHESDPEIGLQSIQEWCIDSQKPAGTEQETTTSKTMDNISIQNFHGIIGDVQAEIVQTGEYSSIHKQPKAENQNKLSVLNILGWLLAQAKWLFAIFWPK